MVCFTKYLYVYKVLGYNNINKVMNKTNINTKNKKYYANFSQCPRGHSLNNMHPNQIFVNKVRLYKILFKSN
jgi:prophage antirepressor-like protein